MKGKENTKKNRKNKTNIKRNRRGIKKKKGATNTLDSEERHVKET